MIYGTWSTESSSNISNTVSLDNPQLQSKLSVRCLHSPFFISLLIWVDRQAVSDLYWLKTPPVPSVAPSARYAVRGPVRFIRIHTTGILTNSYINNVWNSLVRQWNISFLRKPKWIPLYLGRYHAWMAEPISLILFLLCLSKLGKNSYGRKK